MASITRYFALNALDTKGYKATLWPDNDLLPLSNLKVVPGPLLQDGRRIVKAELPGYLIKAMAEHTELADPLTPEGVILLDIADKFAGRTREDVISKFPELAGQHIVGQDEEGNNIYQDNLPEQYWSGEAK